MNRLWAIGFLFLALLITPGLADDSEAYTTVLDRLTSIDHFSENPILFVVGFDTTKSMSVEFDRAKRVTQLILSRYGAPGDSVFIFGFANKPTILPQTLAPKVLPSKGIDQVVASLNEAITSMPRSSDFGTIFGRAKLFALEKVKEVGDKRNVAVLLFTDNNSELDMGVNEREKLKATEASLKVRSETFPLKSQGVSKLWMTLYVNDFPDRTKLVTPDGSSDVDSPRLAWAANRMGSQSLSFTAPANPKIESLPLEVAVHFLGPVAPKQASLIIDGKEIGKTGFDEGRAGWTISELAPGSHLLFAQAVLSDGKVRTAELPITVGLKAASGSSANNTNTSPDAASDPLAATPEATAEVSASPDNQANEKEEGSFAPLIFLGILGLAGLAVYLLSTKPARVRLIGPRLEESYALARGQTLRLGGAARVADELVFSDPALAETIAIVSGQGFGKAKIAPVEPKDGSVELETSEGIFVTESGEELLTTVSITFTSPRGQKEVYTLVKEEQKASSSGGEGHFAGSGPAGENNESSGGDWRS